jgi:MFS family permease
MQTADIVEEVPRSEWREGWPLVLTAALGCAFAASHAVTMGAFVGPLTGEFGWSRGEVTAGISFGALGSIFLVPVLGPIVDKIGARKIGLLGPPAYAAGLLLISLSGPSIYGWYAAWIAMAVLSLFISPLVWTMAVASRFEKSRGLALAFVLAGMSVGAAIFPFAAATLIENFGWRVAYRVNALAALVVVLPLALAFLRDARDLRAAQTDQPLEPEAVVPGLSLREAFRTRTFWQILAMLALVAGVYNAIYQHFQPIMTDAGMTAIEAAAIAGIIGPVSFAARLLTGHLLDRFSPPLVAASAFAIPLLSCLLLIGFDGDPVIAGIAIACCALASGAEIDMIAYLGARYFGMRNYGAIYGFIFAGHTLGWALFPPLVGVAFDRSGSYDAALTIMAVLLVVAVALAASIRKPPMRDVDP